MDRRAVLEELRADVERAEARLLKLVGGSNALLRASEAGYLAGLNAAIDLLESE